MTKRERITWIACFLVMAIGTIIVLSVLQARVDEDARLGEEIKRAVAQECKYAKENRNIVVQVLTDLSRGAFLDAASRQRLLDEALYVQGRVDELQC